MPIEQVCPRCGQTLRVPAEPLGRRLKCAACEYRFVLGAQPLHEGPWLVRTVDGLAYGPASSEDLRRWVGEGRLDGRCEIRATTSDEWQPILPYFPELAPRTAAAVATEPPAEATNLTPRIGDELLSPAAAAPAESMLATIRPKLIDAMRWVTVAAVLALVAFTLAIIGVTVLVTQTGGAGAWVLSGVLLSGAAAAALLWPALSLWVYRRHLERFRQKDDVYSLQRALDAQGSAWRTLVLGAAAGLLLALLAGIAALQAR